MEEQENDEYIVPMISNKLTYMVFKKEWAGKEFYNIYIQKKGVDGTQEKAQIQIRFGKCDPVPDRTIIRIKKAFESWYKKGYQIIPQLVILEYEKIQTSESVAKEAIAEFNSMDYDSDILPF